MQEFFKSIEEHTLGFKTLIEDAESTLAQQKILTKYVAKKVKEREQETKG